MLSKTRDEFKREELFHRLYGVTYLNLLCSDYFRHVYSYNKKIIEAMGKGIEYYGPLIADFLEHDNPHLVESAAICLAVIPVPAPMSKTLKLGFM